MLTACLIARDEARHLPRLFGSLQNLRPVLSAICLVDTGSSDETREIAQAAGARVVTFTECNDSTGLMADFAAARNRAIEMAETEWVLVVDADDVVNADPESVAEFIRTAPHLVNGGMFKVSDSGTNWLQVRLIRKTVRYVGAVHEYPACSQPTPVVPGCEIVHRPDKTGKEGSEQRCARILLGVPAANRSVRDWFYLGRALLNTDRPGAGAAALEEYLSRNSGFPEERMHARIHLADAYNRMGCADKALSIIATAIVEDPRFAEPMTFAADLHFLAGRTKHAAALYRAALSLGGPPEDARLFVSRPKYREYPLAMLAKCGEAPPHA